MSPVTSSPVPGRYRLLGADGGEVESADATFSVEPDALAVEVVTRGGRATYLFRIAPPDVYRSASGDELRRLASERITSVSRAMMALGFKREPIYLSDQAIQSGPYARYRLALRLSAPLRSSRVTFLGRAIHGPAWERQLDAALARALG